MSLDSASIEQIVNQVVSRLQGGGGASGTQTPVDVSGGNGVFSDLDDAIAAATVAQRELVALSLEDRERIVAAMRRCTLDQLESLARDAVQETGLGRVDDKIHKNRRRRLMHCRFPMYLCAVSGYFALRILIRLVRAGDFSKFAYYLWPLAVFALTQAG